MRKTELEKKREEIDRLWTLVLTHQGKRGNVAFTAKGRRAHLYLEESEVEGIMLQIDGTLDFIRGYTTGLCKAAGIWYHESPPGMDE